MKLTKFTKTIIVIADAIIGGLFGGWLASTLYLSSRLSPPNPNVLLDGVESIPIILLSVLVFASVFGVVSAAVLSDSVKRKISLMKTLSGILIVSGSAALVLAYFMTLNVQPTADSLQAAQAGRLLAAIALGAIAFGIVAASYARRLSKRVTAR